MTVSHESSIPGVAARAASRARSRALTVPRPIWGWIALLGAPAAWAVHIGARYPLVPVACDARSVWPLVAVTLGCLLGGGLSLAVAMWLSRRCDAAGTRTPRDRTDEELLAARAPDERALSRLALLGRAGVLTSLVFLGAIAAEGITPLFHDPCAEDLLP